MFLTHFRTHRHQQEQPLLSPKWKKGAEVAGAAAFPDSPTPAGAACPVTRMEKGSRSCRSSSLSSHPNEEETTHASASFHASMSDALNVSDAFPDSPPPWQPARQPMDDHRQPAGQPCTGTTGPRQDAAALGQGGLNNPLEGGIPQPPGLSTHLCIGCE